MPGLQDTLAAPEILALGTWAPDAVACTWREDRFELSATEQAAAREALAALGRRGSPSHDSESTRLASFDAAADALALELQPLQWSARLDPDDAKATLATFCIVRAADGRWLAGRRAEWLAVWPGMWLVGSGGGVGAGEHPAAALGREVQEEWSLPADDLTVTGLVRVPGNTIWLVGLVTVPDDATVIPDAEHDAWAWWPADVADWPAEAGPFNRALAVFGGR